MFALKYMSDISSETSASVFFFSHEHTDYFKYPARFLFHNLADDHMNLSSGFQNLLALIIPKALLLNTVKGDLRRLLSAW